VLGGPSCTGSAADESPDIGAIYTIVLDFFYFFAPFLNQSARNTTGFEKRGNISHILTPVKIRGGLVEMSIRIIRATHRF